MKSGNVDMKEIGFQLTHPQQSFKSTNMLTSKSTGYDWHFEFCTTLNGTLVYHHFYDHVPPVNPKHSSQQQLKYIRTL